jgi:hypothetical protein
MQEDIQSRLHSIEHDLDSGSYRPGPWAALMRDTLRRPESERAALTADITRVSNKLHSRRRRFRLPALLGVAFELALTGGAVVLLRKGLSQRSSALVSAAGAIFSFTAQPLVKVLTGTLCGVRYAYMYVQGGEPKFKMAYGSYVAAPRWKRVLVQASGMLGTPLAFLLVSRLAVLRLPRTAKVFQVLFALFASLQVVLFVAGLLGIKRLGSLETVRSTSGGAAAGEIRDAFLE